MLNNMENWGFMNGHWFFMGVFWLIAIFLVVALLANLKKQ